MKQRAFVVVSSCSSASDSLSPEAARFGQVSPCSELYPGSPPSEFSESQWEFVCGGAMDVECSEVQDYALSQAVHGISVIYSGATKPDVGKFATGAADFGGPEN